ncbi:MAG: hypothetical protein ABR564_04235, partial [Candidatus Dormibacteria bacterium]
VGTHGELLQRIDDPRAPEGMVALPDSRLAVAEQGPNRLVIFQPPSSSVSPLVALPPRGRADGVDGLGFDAARSRILIPDSPHGTLLGMPAAGGDLTLLASGLGRDVAATLGPDGNLWVAVEGPHGLLRVPATGGTAQPVGDLSQLDDIVTGSGLLYATQLVGGRVVAIDPGTGAHRTLVTGIGSAQGLALLPDGRLANADSRSGAIVTTRSC